MTLFKRERDGRAPSLHRDARALRRLVKALRDHGKVFPTCSGPTPPRERGWQPGDTTWFGEGRAVGSFGMRMAPRANPDARRPDQPSAVTCGKGCVRRGSTSSGVRYVLNPSTKDACTVSAALASLQGGMEAGRKCPEEPGSIEGSQMPRHSICDAHEWIIEIPTVPTHCLAKLQPRERAWHKWRGKKTLLSLTLVASAKRC